MMTWHGCQPLFDEVCSTAILHDNVNLKAHVKVPNDETVRLCSN